MKQTITFVLAAILFFTTQSCKKEKHEKPNTPATTTTIIVNNVVTVNGTTTTTSDTIVVNNTGGGGTTNTGGCATCGSLWLLNPSMLNTTGSSWVSEAVVMQVVKTGNCWKATGTTAMIHLNYDTWADLHNYAIMNYSYGIVVAVTGTTYDGYDAVGIYTNVPTSTYVCQ